MKKILSTLCMTLLAAVMMGQEPVITFDKTEHNFGTVVECGKISTIFTFKNEGMSPLVLNDVKASCGCTTPSWTKEPVEPGQTGEITVTYNTTGRIGGFTKTITVKSNASRPVVTLKITGTVNAKQKEQENKFPVAVGAINMKTKTLDLGVIKKGESKSGELEFTNQGKEDHTVELATGDACLINDVTLTNAKPNEIGKFIFSLDTKKDKMYGKTEYYAYVMVDGKKEISEAYKLIIKADIVEDFSQLSILDKQNAPILETADEYNVGTIEAGKAIRFLFPIKNTGVNPLEIRRVYSPDAKVETKAPGAIKSGKKGIASLLINTKGVQPGKYSRQLLIISNDYKNPQKKVTIKWEVQ